MDRWTKPPHAPNPSINIYFLRIKFQSLPWFPYNIIITYSILLLFIYIPPTLIKQSTIITCLVSDKICTYLPRIFSRSVCPEVLALLLVLFWFRLRSSSNTAKMRNVWPAFIVVLTYCDFMGITEEVITIFISRCYIVFNKRAISHQVSLVEVQISGDQII